MIYPIALSLCKVIITIMAINERPAILVNNKTSVILFFLAAQSSQSSSVYKTFSRL